MFIKTPGMQLQAAKYCGTATSSAERQSESWDAVTRGGYKSERQQSPFSFAKRLYVIEYLGENETFAEKDTMRGRKNL